MFCTHCGQSIAAGTTFCSHCGGRQSGAASAPEVSTPPSRPPVPTAGQPLLAVAIGVALVVGLGIGGMLFKSSPPSLPSSSPSASAATSASLKLEDLAGSWNLESISGAAGSDERMELKTDGSSLRGQFSSTELNVTNVQDASARGSVDIAGRGRGACAISRSGQRLRLEVSFPNGEQHILFFQPYVVMPKDQLTECKSNCKNMATALEMYASDNGGKYPLTGQFDNKLTSGNYLRTIPTCPAAGTNTYSPTYRSSQNPDSFSLQCAGSNHAKAYQEYEGNPANYPQYDAEQGLLDHP